MEETPNIDPKDGTHILNKPAEITAETASFLKKGDKVTITRFDPKDGLYLAMLRGAGIWIKASLFKYEEVKQTPRYFF